MGAAERTAAAQALTRQPRARLTIDWTDPYRDVSIVATASEENYTNYPKQAADNVETVPYKWAHLDGTTPISDSIHPMPGSEVEAASYQVGWWGETESQAGGVFSNPPVLQVQFSERPVYSVRVAGDDEYGEYPVDFTVYVYDSYSNILSTSIITGNTNHSVNIDVTSANIVSATRMSLLISKWSATGRVVKISEFFSSVITTYDGDDITYIGILEESEVSNGSLPIGNISANDCDIKLQNLEDTYFPDNDNSPLKDLIFPNRKITVELGWLLDSGTVEYDTVGTYWSGDWSVSEMGVTASTSARDRMEFLRRSNYVPTGVYTDETVYDLLVRVLDDAVAQQADLTYTIDTELQESRFTVPYAVFKRGTHFETIRLLCEASMAFAYCSRDDVVTIIGPTAALGEGASYYDITPDLYFSRVQPIKTDELANIIEVTTNALAFDNLSTRVYTSSEPRAVTAGEVQSVRVEFSLSDTQRGVAGQTSSLIQPDSDPESVATGVSITSSTYYSWGADFEVTATADTSYNIAVDGRYLRVDGQEVVAVRDEESIAAYGEAVYDKLKKNVFIQSRTLAESIAETLLESYSTPRKDVDVDWCGDLALNVTGDFRLPTYIKGAIDNRAIFKTLKNNITFDGSLRMKSSGRRLRDDIEVTAFYQDTDGALSTAQDTDGATDKRQDTDET